MAKEKEWFNEADRYLIQNWPAARLMEQAMESIRKKYTSIFERVIETASRTHEDLDYSRAYVTQHWGPGYIFQNKSVWKCKDKKFPPVGFYIENLRLELLCDRDGPDPYASIWVPAKKTGVDPGEAREAVLAAAPEWLSDDERVRCLKQPSDEEYLLCYDLPEEREELLKMLVEGDAQPFVDCMVRHLDLLARFTPVVDKLLGVASAGLD